MDNSLKVDGMFLRTVEHNNSELEIYSEKMRKCMTVEESYNSRHYIFKFPNGYGASVIPSHYFDGEEHWKLAVVFYYGEDYYELSYSTPITDDVLPNLTVEEVNKYLNYIYEL